VNSIVVFRLVKRKRVLATAEVIAATLRPCVSMFGRYCLMMTATSLITPSGPVGRSSAVRVDHIATAACAGKDVVTRPQPVEFSL
jgi:hypothetical protein